MNIKDFYTLREVDKILAILGIILSIILIIYLLLNNHRLLYNTVGIFTMMACVFWLFIRQKVNLDKFELQSRSVYLTLNAIFFLFFACSILTIHFREDLYTRPLVYFILLSLMAGIVSLEILYYPKKKKFLFLILLQIIIIACSLEWSQALIFQGVVGIDPWYHQAFTLKILDTGFIPENNLYSKLPLMHLGIGANSIVTGLNYKISTILSMGFFQIICGIMFIFLLGKFLFNAKVGLLACLLLAFSNHYIHMGFSTIPNTVAAIFIPIIIYLLFKLKTKNPTISISLSILFMIVLVLTHTLSAMCMAILLFVSWIVFTIYNRIYTKHRKMPVTLSIPIFFSVLMFAWWTYGSGHLFTLVELIKGGFSIDYLLFAPKEIVIYLTSVPIPEQLFNNLGMFLFFTLSFVGCLYMISRRHRNSRTFTMAVVGITPLAIGFFSLITEHSVIEHRWWYFAQILLALPLAIAFFLLCNTIKNNFVRPFLLSAITIFIAFFMIMSTTANIDNNIFSPNTTVRLAFTESELQSIKTISETWNGTIGTDQYYAGTMQWMNYNMEAICEQLYYKNFSNSSDILYLIRSEIISKPLMLFSATYKLDYDPNIILSNHRLNKIYTNHEVVAYI